MIFHRGLDDDLIRGNARCHLNGLNLWIVAKEDRHIVVDARSPFGLFEVRADWKIVRQDRRMRTDADDERIFGIPANAAGQVPKAGAEATGIFRVPGVILRRQLSPVQPDRRAELRLVDLQHCHRAGRVRAKQFARKPARLWTDPFN